MIWNVYETVLSLFSLSVYEWLNGWVVGICITICVSVCVRVGVSIYDLYQFSIQRDKNTHIQVHWNIALTMILIEHNNIYETIFPRTSSHRQTNEWTNERTGERLQAKSDAADDHHKCISSLCSSEWIVDAFIQVSSACCLCWQWLWWCCWRWCQLWCCRWWFVVTTWDSKRRLPKSHLNMPL